MFTSPRIAMRRMVLQITATAFSVSFGAANAHQQQNNANAHPQQIANAHATTTVSERSTDEGVIDCLIIGAGVVGLAVARELSVQGNSVVVLEKSQHICDGASSGNSGLGCTGYDAPKGSLERALLRRSIMRHPNLYRSLGLSYNHVRKCGALVVAWTAEDLRSLKHILEENIEAGDLEARILSKVETLNLEKGLNQSALGSVLCNREMVTEPWLVPVAYANSAILHGAKIYTENEVQHASYDKNKRLWEIKTKESNTFYARTLINCGGLYGDKVDQMCNANEAAKEGEGEMQGKERGEMKEGLYKILPRKGQFIVFKGTALPSVSVSGESDLDSTVSASDEGPEYIIQQVPSLQTKGIIVWKSVYGNVLCGPTAQEQESRTDRASDHATTEMLYNHAINVYPSLANESNQRGERSGTGINIGEVIGTYSGIRPATQHRDYQIRLVPEMSFISVGGIRSTGLTAASGIAEYVHALVMEQEHYNNGNVHSSDKKHHNAILPQLAENVVPPYLPSVEYNIAWNSESNGTITPNPPIPELSVLARDYQKRGDGFVEIFGKLWKVTHPLSILGMEKLEIGKKDGE